MIVHFDYEILEELSKGKGLNQIQNVFNTLISELIDYLKLQPLYQNVIVKLISIEKPLKGENIPILDFGANRITRNDKLIIEVDEIYERFLPFILFREAFYCFVDKEASELVKICINQIVENDFSRLSGSKEWKKLIRDSLVDRDFIHSQLDKLQKFFKIEAKDPLESSIQFFFKEIRKNILMSDDSNIDRFYDLIFERYTYKTSKSLFNQEIVESLRIINYLFYETKVYQNLSDYQSQFKKFKENQKIDSDLSLRKFNDNLLWINKCSSIAPSYDVSYSTIDLWGIIGIINFNPLLEKNKIKMLMEEWPFYSSPKFSQNSFATEISLLFIIPKPYSKDLLNYFNRLEVSGYIIKKELYYVLKKRSFINLNYFTDISNIKKIIDPNNIKYEQKFEIESIIEYPAVSRPHPLSIFDFTILDRVRNFSITGLTFDKRIETLNVIKEDVENELRKQITINKEFKASLDKVLNSPKLKQQFLQFLDENQAQGFLYLNFQLNYVLQYINLIEKVLSYHPEITNIHQLHTFLNTKLLTQTIEEYLLIRNENIKKNIFYDFLSLYFQSISLFREEVLKVQDFCNVLNACYNLKILDLNKVKRIVKELDTEGTNLAKEIYRKREKRYEDVFKSISLYKITNEKIESTIEGLLNHDPPVIKPFLINTIFTSTFAKYYPILILKSTPEVYKGLKELKLYFPRIYIYEMTNLITKRNLICILIYFLNIKEKELFLSILYSYFKGFIISIKRYFWRGVKRLSKYEPRDFYDFENKKFIYSKDLFEQLFTYTQKILGKKLKWPENQPRNVKEIFWSKKQNMDTLVNSVKSRISHQNIKFDLKELDDFLEFRKNLETSLLDRSKFITFKTKNFFKRYVDSIKFLPAFQKFGFSQYYLYFRPFDYNNVDFRLIFINSFQDIKCPACIEPGQAIFCEYIFPFRTPNKSYLNWLVKSKKNVSEYCLFHKKKFYDIIHFNRNLTKEGWNYSSIRFKSYMQDVLFNPTYDPKISGIREFDTNEILGPNIHGLDTQEYEALTQIYNIHSIDIKSYLGTMKHSIINNITELLKKKLIFPYISLRNLDFQDKLSIILPNVKKEFNEKLIKIFSFFNVCRIYDIEGEFFIYGFEDIKPFENGLLIEIWFPKCEMDEFIEVFDLLFQYFEVKHHLILSDLVSGTTLLKSVFGNLDFLKVYNPLKNLKWNSKDKIWMNPKLFNEKFEPIYPDLLSKEKE